MICPMVCPMIPSGNTASYKGELQRWSYKGGATTATEDGPKNISGSTASYKGEANDMPNDMPK